MSKIGLAAGKKKESRWAKKRIPMDKKSDPALHNGGRDCLTLLFAEV